MSLDSKLAAQISAAAQKNGLAVTAAEPGTSFNGTATTRFTIALAADPSKTETLELASTFDAGDSKFAAGIDTYFAESAKRLRNPRPDCYITLGGLPISFRTWAWPFHRSTSGADSFIVHGEAWVEDGKTAAEVQLRAKVSASMTVTFSEVIAAPEQIFSESFIYNAVRKILDQGQLELVKSGARQPVPVTTRYYSPKQRKFIFNDTDDQQLHDFLAAKVYWLSGVLGNNEPVWVLDPRDAQYLNTTVEKLKKVAESLAQDGILQLQRDTEFATPSDGLMSHTAQYAAELQEALDFTRPTFNEEMRAGHTNM